MRRPPPVRPEATGEHLAVAALLITALFVAIGWLVVHLAALLAGRGWDTVPRRAVVALLIGVAERPADPLRAVAAGDRRLLPPAGELWLSLALVAAAVAAAALLALSRRPAHRSGSRFAPRHGALVRRRRRQAPGRAAAPAFWAGRAELAPLLVRRPEPGRLVLGRSGPRLVAAEPGQSLLVAGPSQCGKTSGLAVPAILEWRGPVVATSVKTDLLRDTVDARRGAGEVLVYDPTGSTGFSPAGWSPLHGAVTWSGARALAAGLCSVARAGGGGLDDAAFWYATAEKLLAPLLFAAATSGGTIADVVRWVDTEEVGEVMLALELAAVGEALQAARASFGREERQRSSVYTTAETVLAGFADPGVAACSNAHDIDAARLFGGGAPTVYLVAPAHEQERLQAVFVALLRQLLEAAFARSSLLGEPLAPALLVVLDEAANVAPLANLDSVASTAAGHGVQLVTIWQDFAQIQARYGGRWATVVNNHRAKLFCSGIGDPSTLEHASRLIGDSDEPVDSFSRGPAGELTTTRSSAPRPLAPADALRRLPRGEAVLVYGNLPPAAVQLRGSSAGARRSRRRPGMAWRGHR